MRFIINVGLVIILLVGCKPVSNILTDEKLKLYNEILDQIISDNYFQYCLVLDEKTKKIESDFYKSKIDSITYLKIGDSLKLVRKQTLPRCVLSYTSEFQIFTAARKLSTDIESSIAEGLKDEFLTKNFGNISAETIIDTLSRTAQLNAKDLAISYLEITPYIKRQNRPYGDGIGVMGFSRIYFNKEVDKAIVYYEFNCGPKCGTGEVVFIEKVAGKWMVIAYKGIWDS